MPALDQNDLTAINSSLEAIAAVEEDVKRAKVAGIDVSSQETILAERKTALLKIKAAYFPN